RGGCELKRILCGSTKSALSSLTLTSRNGTSSVIEYCSLIVATWAPSYIGRAHGAEEFSPQTHSVRLTAVTRFSCCWRLRPSVLASYHCRGMRPKFLVG